MKAYYVCVRDNYVESRCVDYTGRDVCIARHATVQEALENCNRQAMATGLKIKYTVLPEYLAGHVPKTTLKECYLVYEEAKKS